MQHIVAKVWLTGALYGHESFFSSLVCMVLQRQGRFGFLMIGRIHHSFAPSFLDIHRCDRSLHAQRLWLSQDSARVCQYLAVAFGRAQATVRGPEIYYSLFGSNFLRFPFSILFVDLV